MSLKRFWKRSDIKLGTYYNIVTHSIIDITEINNNGIHFNTLKCSKDSILNTEICFRNLYKKWVYAPKYSSPLWKVLNGS